MYRDAFSFGREVLGPICADFARRIWLYSAQAEATHTPALLFCARGGVGIRMIFEAVREKLELPMRAVRHNVMVSRVVAARAAVLTRSSAAAQELDREFRTDTLAAAARALGASRRGEFVLGSEWERPFHAQTFMELLFGEPGSAILEDVREQNQLFTRHLRELVGNADRIILCDTGLYGSTQRMLAAGYPELSIETVQFARSNYKGHSEEHFPKVAGLLVERTGYSPLDVPSCVLRYWHVIESLFEPSVPSVRTFVLDAQGRVQSNSGELEHGALGLDHFHPLLQGALAYVNALSAASLGEDAARAWQQLKRAITVPSDADLTCLALADRSVDFGRSGQVQVLTQPRAGHFTGRLLAIKGQLWREGAVAHEFPLLKHALLPLLELVQSARGLRQLTRR